MRQIYHDIATKMYNIDYIVFTIVSTIFTVLLSSDKLEVSENTNDNSILLLRVTSRLLQYDILIF